MILSKNCSLTIITPEEATSRERFAAQELTKYLNKIFGINADFKKASESCCGNAIIIGGPERNAKSAEFLSADEFKSEVPGPEGFMIKSLDDKNLMIAGSSWNTGECERGTIYGTYEFLEKFLGCTLAAFSHPDKDAGEIVPELDEVTLDGIYHIKAKADRPYRTAIVQFADAATPDANYERILNLPFIDWLVKNRYNRILTWTSIYDTFKDNGFLEEIERRGLRFTVGHHEASRLFLPGMGNQYFSEHYYETHPEYFKLLEDGTRFSNTDHWGQWVFCSRNENAIEEVAKNVTEWLGKNPSVDILAFWPNDGTFPQCCCDDCKPYTKTENYCYFVNEVAKRVKKTHPHIKFDMLIYTDLWSCPEGLQLDPCILIDESTWHISGLRTVGKPDGTSLIGTFYQENLLNWRKTGADVVYYDYYMGVYGLRQRMIPMADELRSLWQSFVKEDIAGSGTQIECFNMWNHLFNFYCFARTGYDTSLSMLDNLNSFKKLFGKGGDELAAAIVELEECLDGQVEIQSCGHYLMEHINKESVYAHFDKALELAESPRFRNNIRLIRMVFRYSDLETKEEASRIEQYRKTATEYLDPTGELGKMTEYDSFVTNEPGWAIAFPLKSNNNGKYTSYDKWYDFE